MAAVQSGIRQEWLKVNGAYYRAIANRLLINLAEGFERLLTVSSSPKVTVRRHLLLSSLMPP